MANRQVAPCGSWKSPIRSDLVASAAIGLSGIALDGDDIYWVEGRPAEGGRNVIVRRSPSGEIEDVTPKPFNARTRVHEYGGGAFAVCQGAVYFSNFDDQRVYCHTPGDRPRPLTPEVALRYADGVVDPRHARMICVREDHTAKGEAVNTLVSLDLMAGGPGQVLVAGSDFYSTPRLSCDGSQLAWLSWNHPNMPWDGTDLWVASLQADGTLGAAEHVAGGKEESIFQPSWSPDGTLYFISDRTGWWNLYVWRNGRVRPVLTMEAEFGLPQWRFGMSSYSVVSSERIVCSYSQGGLYHLVTVDPKTGELQRLGIPFTWLSSVQATDGRVVFLAGSPTESMAIVLLAI